MTTFSEIAPSSRARRSRSPRGPSATPAPASRCSARRAPRAPCRRRSPTPRRCTASPASRRRSPCTSRGTRSTTTPRCARYAADLGVALGTINSNTFQDDDYKFGSLTHTDDAGPPEGDRPPPRVHRHHGRHRLARPQDLARRRHQLPGPGRHPRPPGPARRVAARDLRPARRRPATGARVQVLRAGVLPHRRPGLGHVVRPGARPSATGRWSASTPATTRPAPTSSSSSMQLLRLGKLGSFDFNSPLLRRRRPDRRGGRPVPAVPDPVRGDPRRRLRPGQPTSRSCSTSATTSRTRSPARSARCSTCRR